MSNTKTEAQRLADRTTPYHGPHAQSMARELRRLDAENQQLRAQLAKAVAEEREACAKVCESEPERIRGDGIRAADQLACAAAIRARSNT